MVITRAFDPIRRAGLLDPLRIGAGATAGLRWGNTLATYYGAAAMRTPAKPAVIDHRGSLTFARLDRRSTALAHGLVSMGLRRRDHLGVLCRNHRDFLEVSIASAKAGLTPVYLNTGSASPELGQILEREGVRVLICDADLLATVDSSGFGGPVVVADGPGSQTLRDLRRAPWQGVLIPRASRPVLLTSGTTGVPKGAQPSARVDPRAGLSLFKQIPYKTGDVFLISAPLFHAWGLAQLTLAAALGSTVVVSRGFDPEEAVGLIVEHDVTAVAAVPIMLQRILAVEALDHSLLGGLRVVASSGSELRGELATTWMDLIGDTLYNLYGSTEVGLATLATPGDLRRAPGSVGKALPGSKVRILDDDGQALPNGETGRIFVGSRSQFSQYTGGGTREVIDGLMASGDMGYFDDDQRLWVTGRADDMIVSGAENVFPGEVEAVLVAHPGVEDAAVVGVADEEFGARLVAFVVSSPGSDHDSDSIRELVATRLARHKVPRNVEFVEEIPRTATGKVIRGRLGVGAR